jgi:hypothetical protein
MEYHIITILAVVVIYNLWRYYHEDKQPEYCSSTGSEENCETMIETKTISAMDNNELPKEEKPATKDLAYSLLHKLGCAPEETEDGRIRLEFQGITFLMEAINDCLFVNLIWPWCHSFSIFDIDEFARVRKVVNEININSSCSVFYIPNPESDEVAVHIKKNLLLTPQIPNIEEYMKVMFRSFFAAQRELVTEIEKYRLQECEK